MATDWALYHQAGQSWTRLGWEQVGRVDWDAQRHVLILTSLTPAVPAPTVLRLASDCDLPAVAAERVTWAKLVDLRVSLGGDARARVVAQRRPGDEPVKWLVILGSGLDPGDPAIRAELKSALAELQAATGAGDAAGFGPGIVPPW